MKLEQQSFLEVGPGGREQIVKPAPMAEVFDICRGRHGGNSHSEHANAVNMMHRDQQRAKVLEAIAATGINGLTCKELARTWDVDMNTISGRFSELKAAGRIIPAKTWQGKDVRRGGCGAYMVNKQAVGTGPAAGPGTHKPLVRASGVSNET